MSIQITNFFFLLISFWGLSIYSFAQGAANCSLSGKITDLSGEYPLPDTKILITDSTKAEYSTITDKEGHYLFTRLACGKATVFYEQRGFYKETVQVDLISDIPKIFNLGMVVGKLGDTPAVSIKGRIVDERKKPVKKVEVKITAILNGRIGDQTISQNGKFELTVIDRGKYILEVFGKNKLIYKSEIFIDYFENKTMNLKEIVLGVM